MVNIKSIASSFFLGVFLVFFFTPNVFAQIESFDGKPEFKEGTDMGYFIWHEGDTWKLRWTTMGQRRHFTGHVTAEDGELKSLKRIDVESERKVIRPGRAPHVAVGPRGRVYRRGGVAPVVVEKKEDQFEKDGDRRINFSTFTDDDIDGFDFKVDKNVTALRFVLEINGKALPRFIETGRNNQHPPGVPFVVKLR